MYKRIYEIYVDRTDGTENYYATYRNFFWIFPKLFVNVPPIHQETLVPLFYLSMLQSECFILNKTLNFLKIIFNVCQENKNVLYATVKKKA